MHLITIPFSHYNEKARWALDRFGVEYKQSGYMPVLHFLPAMIASRGRGRADRQSSRFSTPILLTDRGETICDSGEIMRYVSDRFARPGEELYPDSGVAAAEKVFNEVVAPATRRIAYFHLLPSRSLAMKLARRNVGMMQSTIFGLAFFAGRKFMRKRLVINAESTQRSLEKLRGEIATLETTLADGRRFLVGDRFTAADISFACSLAPALLVTREEGFGATYPDISEVPEGMAAVAREIRQSAAGRFALRLFREQRKASRHFR